MKQLMKTIAGYTLWPDSAKRGIRRRLQFLRLLPSPPPLLLRMCWTGNASSIKPQDLPDGYAFRKYRGASDIKKWVELVRKADGFGYVSKTTFENEISDEERLCLLFVVKNGVYTTTAGGCKWPQLGANCAVINYVANDPQYRGMKLGLACVTETMSSVVASGYSLIIVHTEDFRLAAINTYLRLGFRPCLQEADPSQKKRWRKIYNKIGLKPERLVVHRHR